MAIRESRRLKFVENTPDDFLRAFDELLNAGAKSFLLHGGEEEVAAFAIKLKQTMKEGAGKIHQCVCHPDGSVLTKDAQENIDAVFVLVKEAGLLSRILMSYSETHCAIVAPITEHFFKNRPVFVNSIPKSGVHMLFECMKAFGYKMPANLNLPNQDEDLLAGTFYNLQHATLDYIAAPYMQIGKFIACFSRAVVVFMIRDPRDIAISLARYLATHSDYHILKKYFEALPREKQITAVLKGEYPFPVHINRRLNFSGTIRELILLYSNWIQYPFSNVIFVRYEELVGSKGGGRDALQWDCLWRIQLALHVPGCPQDYATNIYNTSTATFRRGKIGGFSDEFAQEHLRIFQEFPQDFMRLCGYDFQTSQPVRLSLDHFKGFISLDMDKSVLQPILLEEGYKGFNVIFCKNKYYAIHQSLGSMDLTQISSFLILDYQKNNQCFIADSQSGVKRLVDDFLLLDRFGERILAFEKEILECHKKIANLNLELDFIKSAKACGQEQKRSFPKI